MAPKQILLIVQRSDGEAEILKEAALDLITLPHPKGTPVVYVQISGNILELQSVELKKHASWFINQKVSSSSSFYMASKLDPRFLCLPFFEKAGSRYSPLDQIITPTEGCARIPLTNYDKWRLDEIADVKDLGDDLILFRFNEVKTMDWLNSKIKKTALLFMTKRCSKKSTDNATFVGTFVSSAQSSKSSMSTATSASVILEPEKIDIKMALQVVSDYLTDSVTEKLVKMLGLSISDLADTKSQNTKRKADWEAELEIEEENLSYINAQKVPVRAPPQNTSSAPSKPMTSSKQVASSASTAAKKKVPEGKMGKPVQGAKSISSFFGKK